MEEFGGFQGQLNHIVGARQVGVPLGLAGLAALVLLINVFMHDFWNAYESTDTGHETQNFVKNLGIFAGLLVLAGCSGPARNSTD